MTGSREVGGLDATGALETERAAFVTLLEQLSADEWTHSTECPAWTVKGIALHVLGDDLSCLARERDQVQPAGFRNDSGDCDGSYRSIDKITEGWVGAGVLFAIQVSDDLHPDEAVCSLDWCTMAKAGEG